MPTPRVLVLEDEPLIAVMVRGWLTELGCEPVGPAHTVQSAIALIEGGRLDGAILDVTIGDQDCSAVADSLGHRGIPFAFATGRAVEALAARYPGAPSLSKPYDFAALQGVMAELLGTPARPGATA
jgi:CheY-like chemotaxis protein